MGRYRYDAHHAASAGDGWQARYRTRPIYNHWHLARRSHHPPLVESGRYCVRGRCRRDFHYWCQKQSLVHSSFGTAFLILTIELFGMTDFAAVHQIAWYRIIDNVIGALIALFFGLLVPQVLIRMKRMQTTSIPKIKA